MSLLSLMVKPSPVCSVRRSPSLPGPQRPLPDSPGCTEPSEVNFWENDAETDSKQHWPCHARLQQKNCILS